MHYRPQILQIPEYLVPLDPAPFSSSLRILHFLFLFIFCILPPPPADTSIVGLDLRYNKITDEGALVLAKALKKNRSLEYLSIAGNKLTAQGVVAVLKAVKRNTSLKVLDLG